MVLYIGLLEEAHEKGLQTIRTELLQAPTTANGETAIVHATALFKDGRSFDGIGDANPVNVSKNIVPHAIRMAETRAKARALRDGLNVNAVSVEEMMDEVDVPTPPPRQLPRPERISMDQSATIGKLCIEKRGWVAGEFQQRIADAYKVASFADLTAEQAAGIIRGLEAEVTRVTT